MKNQTAVDWLVEQLNTLEILVDKESQKKAIEIFEQAKAMEKEHLMMAFNDGKVNSVLNKRNSEQYYTSTYEK
jgi:hypothetical protein